MNNSAASQEERERKRAGAVGKSNQNLHTNNLCFVVFLWRCHNQPKEKAIGVKRVPQNPKQMKVDDEADGTVSPTPTHTKKKKKNCLAFDVGPFRRKALVRLAKKIVGRRPLRKWHREDPGALTDRARQG